MTQSTLENLKPGTTLTTQESRALDRVLAEALKDIDQRRKGMLLVHDSLQNTIGLFYQLFDWKVAYEVPFNRGEWGPERMIFDLVATKGRQEVMVEVKDFVGPRDLGQVWGYIKALKLSKEKTKVFLGTDVLNYGRLLDGTIGAMVKELMEQEGMGLILADKYLMVLFRNYAQLSLEEMPELWASEDKVG